MNTFSGLKFINIETTEAEELRIYSDLNEAQLKHYNEPDFGIFIAESPKVIERALNAGYTPVSVLIEDKNSGHCFCKDNDNKNETQNETYRVLNRLSESVISTDHSSANVSETAQLPVYTAPESILCNITGFKLTRGMLCAFLRKPLMTVSDLLSSLNTDHTQKKNRIAILEDVVNPTNVGAIFRNAAALNVDAVILTSASADPLYRRAERVSMGTVFQIPWTITDVPLSDNRKNDLFHTFHDFGYKTAAFALKNDSVSIDDKKLMNENKLAIILGTEGDGLKMDTILNCDYTVKIPMTHGVDSLNVSAAAAVAFWQLCSRNDN